MLAPHHLRMRGKVSDLPCLGAFQVHGRLVEVLQALRYPPGHGRLCHLHRCQRPHVQEALHAAIVKCAQHLRMEACTLGLASGRACSAQTEWPICCMCNLSFLSMGVLLSMRMEWGLGE